MWTVEKCEVCGSRDFDLVLKIPDYIGYRKISRDTLFSLMKCRNCNHWFILERIDRDRLKEIYGTGEYTSFSAYSNPEYRETLYKIADIFVKDIARFIQPHDKKLFEIGCSYGHLLKRAEAAGFTVKGIEPSVEASRCGSDNLGIDVTNSTLEDFTPGSEKYDVVVAVSVFEHVYDVEKSMMKIIKMMHEDSLLYIEVPSVDSIWIKLLGKIFILRNIRKRRGMFHPVEHVRYFSIKSMFYFLGKYFNEINCIPDPRWGTYYKRDMFREAMAKIFKVSPTGNIVFVASSPKLF